ncbi:type II toxin-antitoxin system antitoxin SocA domain-containing protein [Nodularia sp. UHCC 0506]|uniref:type II toxin-antitoxin system antitoxin SocA domain-containing protein n=1 Tax=Nodularia sp. UHCC 0506 TaxID=3110243 RepID=UPI002B1FC8EA|nr:type II toxin-antitoxin system antitoxin SocA domain-containing protein [Nodularia sp. UHCC 0506]MEA5514069.1 type II toxin-antitoxin system antitoxin SocA domain-containing protein [Nodularia sp. UHCC 0506]
MLDKLIKYFVYATKGYITKTQLIKFLYLADLYSIKWTGKQLTDLDWRYYQFGPWNEGIDTALNQMNGKEIIQESQYNATYIKPVNQAAQVDDLQIPLSIKFVLDNIRREWAGADKLDQLLDYVYDTAPMLEAKNTHKPEEKVKLNLQAEREKLVSELGL